MKTIGTFFLLSCILFSATQLFAADRVVQFNGPAGTYASITAAIGAAVDGDNVVINNRPDALPWVENLTINKSLTFVSAADNVQWWMEGTISIVVGEGRNITMVGMKNTLTTGNITKTGTATNRTLVNMLNCDVNANITMGSGVNFYLGSSRAKEVVFSFGKIIGNDLKTLECIADNVVTEDVNLVIGNRLGYWTNPTNSSVLAFEQNSTTQYLYFSNNFVYGGTFNSALITSLKAGSVTNRVINSTFSCGNATTVNLTVAHNAGQLSLENNVFAGSSNSMTGIAISVSATALTTPTYNMYFNPPGWGGTTLSPSLNNFSSTNAYFTNINTDGSFISATEHVNAGNPLNDYLDLDLSRNDIGVFGGSYSMANFLPLMNNAESSRVNYMTTPRIVNLGGTVNVQAIGFDK